jgi:phosphoribosyl-ATP pyrophosphohydrolase
MTKPGMDAPGLEAAVSNLIAALNSPNHGSVGAALADLIGAIDQTAGSDLSAAAAHFMGGVTIPVASAADLSAGNVAPAPESAPLPEGQSLGAELDHLSQTIAARAGDDAKSSYTASLLAAGVEKCAKKLGEEAVETALAAAKADKQQIAAEAADLVYHLLVLLQASGVSGDEVAAVLKSRRGVSGLAEKASRAE